VNEYVSPVDGAFWTLPSTNAPSGSASVPSGLVAGDDETSNVTNTGLLASVTLHESVTVPVYPLAEVTVIAEVGKGGLPALTELALNAAAEIA